MREGKAQRANKVLVNPAGRSRIRSWVTFGGDGKVVWFRDGSEGRGGDDGCARVRSIELFGEERAGCAEGCWKGIGFDGVGEP